jgi:hypothetical protein
MADTVLGDSIELLQDFGFFDVVLPFLLVFTIVFGVLEKTRIFGTEKLSDGKEYSKKNIDAMVAFSIAFFVIASKEIVTSIQESLPMVSLILVAIICFLMLVGAFTSSKEEFDFYKMFGHGWAAAFAGIFIVVLVLIFFESFGWLTPIWDYFTGIGEEVFITIVFLIISIGIMVWIFSTGGGKSGGSD